MYDSFWGLILVNTAFETGFCAFVLGNYMKTLPQELYEADQVDGASVVGQFFTDYNLLSAGSIVVALPTLLIFFLLQKQFVSGLTLGATKG